MKIIGERQLTRLPLPLTGPPGDSAEEFTRRAFFTG